MPRADVIASLPRVEYLGQLVQAKLRWKVSVAALNYQLHKIGIISDWRYRDFCIEIATRRYNKEEPNPILRETSAVWQKVLKALWAERTTHAHIAQALAVPQSEIRGLIFGMIPEPSKPSIVQPLSLVAT